MKPTIDLYIGKKVIGTVHGEQPWQWGIRLEGDVEIRNKDERETWAANEQVMTSLDGYRLMALSLSPRDTTLHFAGPAATKIEISYSPTKYAIFDPKYGTESFPQWPEELEEMGIPAIEGGELTGPPSEEWAEQETRLVEEREAKRGLEATEFLADMEEQ